jgi:phosphinothricin acetyltransferase
MDNPTQLQVRVATEEDASSLLEIYAPYVEKTVITFEYDVPTVEEFRERIRHTLKRYPYLVAEENGSLLGYAYVSAFKGRAAYDWSVETSIYVREDIRGRGIGKMLYRALEETLKKQHICNLCACIAYPNPASEEFHHKFGYRTAAHFHNSGYKGQQWVDMIWMEKELCPHSIPPLPFIPFPELGLESRKEDTKHGS